MDACRPGSDLHEGCPSAAPFHPIVDWAFVAEALEGLPGEAVDGFMSGAVADARDGLAELRSPSLPDEARVELAHRLKGTARTFGLVDMGHAAAAIEHAAREGRGFRLALGRFAAALEATATQLAAGRPPLPE